MNADSFHPTGEDFSEDLEDCVLSVFGVCWFDVCVHMLARFPNECRPIHLLYICFPEDVINEAGSPKCSRIF